ncbi:MAG: metal-dependent hydrolase [Eggerthellaceae bacterium]|nr:metal-dependent hydrolase [Eggerthellaceae bacterium]
MMGETHVAVGAAAAAVIACPSSFEECLMAAAVGAMGGVVCDLDVRTSRVRRDALRARIAVLVIAVAALIFGVATRDVFGEMLSMSIPIRFVAGVAVLVAVGVFARMSGHRGFSHSLLAMLLFSAGFGLLSIELVLPFAVGFLSHLVLDAVNKKPIKVFYPMGKGIGLGLCRADGLVNRMLLIGGSALLLLEFAFAAGLL